MRTDQLTHEREIEKLKMQYAIDHSNSKVAELNGKLKSCELMIQHLNQRVDDSKEDREKLSKCKVVYIIEFNCYYYIPVVHLQ